MNEAFEMGLGTGFLQPPLLVGELLVHGDCH
ncbi:hypothetical protein SAMN04488556_0007 [Halostagnicola kamekurae]|uniref:Uncharacterized protein n=1 Tax=Halostagnicola kamekurae TaxID=619731 RepID=A0A1I6V2P5_9EURY|nr:hypothetical protein SAMN04488556_0007 [Halostagnicola kamekurae]